MSTILQEVQKHAVAWPVALQSELLDYAMCLDRKAHASALATSRERRRERLAEALERATALNPFGKLSDPVTWQREQRRDRPLPGRNHAD